MVSLVFAYRSLPQIAPDLPRIGLSRCFSSRVYKVVGRHDPQRVLFLLFDLYLWDEFIEKRYFMNPARLRPVNENAGRE